MRPAAASSDFKTPPCLTLHRAARPCMQTRVPREQAVPCVGRRPTTRRLRGGWLS
jgi:hypothetical protein